MACFHNFNKDSQINHNPEDTPKRAVLTWKPESTHHRAQKSSEVLAAPGGKISKLLDMNTIWSVSHWDTAETHATGQRHHGGHVWGRFPDPCDKVTQRLPRDRIRGSGGAVGPGLVITLASPLMFPTLAPSPGTWGMGRPPFKGHSHQGSSGVLSGHAWSMLGGPWLEWPRHVAAHPPRPPLPRSPPSCEAHLQWRGDLPSTPARPPRSSPGQPSASSAWRQMGLLGRGPADRTGGHRTA